MAEACCGGARSSGRTASKLIWLSDPHVSAVGPVQGIDTVARLRAAVNHINAHHSDADFVVLSGDVVEGGTAGDYAAAAGVLVGSRVPVLPLVGNHDVRAGIHGALPLPPSCMADFVQYQMSLAGADLLCLDTLDDGKSAGVLCDERLRWLEDALRGSDRAALLFMHHPPMMLGLPMLDPDNLANGAAVLDLIESSGRPANIFAGHVHRPVSGIVRGIPFSTIQAVSYQAPPPSPAWDWESFAPANEPPALGVILVEDGQVTVQLEMFCAADDGVVAV